MYGFAEEGGTNYIEYVSFRRKDACQQGLTYELELTESLSTSAWTNVGYEVTGTATYDVDLRAITNRVLADTATKFILLQIDKN